MMTSEEKERIRASLENTAQPLVIRMHANDDSPGRMIREFCETLRNLCPKIQLTPVENGEGAPFFKIADNVTYQAVPLGPELTPFLNFLSGFGRDDGIRLPHGAAFDQIVVPAYLVVFIAPQCPHCPGAVAVLLRLAAACKNIHVRVVDGEMFVQMAADEMVRAAPTTILDHDFRWSGAIAPRELVDAIVHRDPARLSADTLQQMIEEKSPETISNMMVASGKVYPGVIDLLTHEKWSVRLGSMVVFEFINTASTRLALAVIDELWARFESVADDVKGDILYLYGESGRPEIIERVKLVQAGSYAESVREAAAEALETLAG